MQLQHGAGVAVWGPTFLSRLVECQHHRGVLAAVESAGALLDGERGVRACARPRPNLFENWARRTSSLPFLRHSLVANRLGGRRLLSPRCRATIPEERLAFSWQR